MSEHPSTQDKVHIPDTVGEALGGGTDRIKVVFTDDEDHVFKGVTDIEHDGRTLILLDDADEVRVMVHPDAWRYAERL